MNKCTNCGKELKPNAKFCPKCGVEVQGEGILKCPNCDKILNPGTVFCPDCGTHIAVNESDKRKKIARLVEKYRYKIDDGNGTFYTFRNVSSKDKANTLKFDKNLDLDTLVCIVDRTIMHSGKEGLLFTLTGFYEHTGPFAGANFFKYSDIDDMQALEDGELRVYFKDYEKPRDIPSFYHAEQLKELIEKIIELDKVYGTSYLQTSSSGHTSGYLNNADRKAYLEGQKSGYTRCSRQYEIKLRRQADLFLKKEKKWNTERDEYEQLLNEYAQTVAELEQKVTETGSSEYREQLERVRETQQELKDLSN